jgi:hypothetical protein
LAAAKVYDKQKILYSSLVIFEMDDEIAELRELVQSLRKEVTRLNGTDLETYTEQTNTADPTDQIKKKCANSSINMVII